MKTAALYVRVSTNHQNIDTQLLPLRDYAARRGFETTLEYIDEGISGGKRDRIRLTQLMRDAKLRRFDAVIVARFDRFARSTAHLFTALEEFQALGVDFVSLNESIDTTTPMGKMVFSVVAAVAEFEREIIKERIHAGLDRARREGKQLGRPKKIFDRDQVARLSDGGMSARKIARKLNISDRVVRRAIEGRGKNPVPNFAAGEPCDGA